MDTIDTNTKPVIVRVKRKVGHSPLDAFWLEINERPSKRTCLDLSKLSISESEKKVESSKPKKVLVRHLETVTDSETTTDIIHSFFNSDQKSCSKDKKFEHRKIAFKKVNRKEQRLTKAVQQQHNARFKQIWRSRKGNMDQELDDKCNFFDVIRIDAQDKPNKAPEDVTSLEEQKLMAGFLPLLRECFPIAAEDIETDIRSDHTEEDYVYDFYAVNQDMDISEDTCTHQFPLVIVEEEEEYVYDEPDSSDYDSDDSNAEAHPWNDYPEDMSEEEEEEEEEEDEDEKERERERLSLLFSHQTCDLILSSSYSLLSPKSVTTRALY